MAKKRYLSNDNAVLPSVDVQIEDSIQREIYNNVNKSNANFVKRLKSSNRKSIRDWQYNDRIATHKLSVGTDAEGRSYIYPEVQEINGKLVDFTRPPYAPWIGRAAAEERGDTVRVPTIESGIKFTENYKKYYPKGNTFKDGGKVNILPEVVVKPDVPYYYHGYDNKGNPIYNTNKLGSDTEANALLSQQRSKEIKDKQDYIRNLNKSIFNNINGKRLASTLSVVGGGISLIPHPAAKIIGLGLSVPDFVYDVDDFVNKPNLSNATHLALDIPSGISKYNFDEVSTALGIADDGYYALTNKNIEDNNLKSKTYSVGKIKTKRKPSIKSYE